MVFLRSCQGSTMTPMRWCADLSVPTNQVFISKNDPYYSSPTANASTSPFFICSVSVPFSPALLDTMHPDRCDRTSVTSVRVSGRSACS